MTVSYWYFPKNTKTNSTSASFSYWAFWVRSSRCSTWLKFTHQLVSWSRCFPTSCPNQCRSLCFSSTWILLLVLSPTQLASEWTKLNWKIPLVNLLALLSGLYHTYSTLWNNPWVIWRWTHSCSCHHQSCTPLG